MYVFVCNIYVRKYNIIGILIGTTQWARMPQGEQLKTTFLVTKYAAQQWVLYGCVWLRMANGSGQLLYSGLDAMKFFNGLHSILQEDLVHSIAKAGRRVLQIIQFLQLFLKA